MQIVTNSQIFYLLLIMMTACNSSRSAAPPQLHSLNFTPSEYLCDGLILRLHANGSCDALFENGKSRVLISEQDAERIFFNLNLPVANAGSMNNLDDLSRLQISLIYVISAVSDEVNWERENSGTQAIDLAQKWVKSKQIYVENGPTTTACNFLVSLSNSEVKTLLKALDNKQN